MNGHSSNDSLGGAEVAEDGPNTSAGISLEDPNATIDSLKLGQKTLPSDQPMYLCRECGAQLALQDELISKSFSGRQGRAYLFHSTFNTKIGSPEDRQLLTGWHTVADVQCLVCDTVVGWTYLKAWEPSQKYKEGRFIMESAMLHKANNWS
ncbi:unnamed protein product [Sympodiomycopsis kandeliae]